MFDIRFFQETSGQCPVLRHLNEMPVKAEAKGYARIDLLAKKGNRLKRPHCDYLRDGIYELRWRFVKVQYRLLYFFSGEKIIVLSHIIIKEKKVPKIEIERCINNKIIFEKNPKQHMYILEEGEV